jgi:hypothetical protein
MDFIRGIFRIARGVSNIGDLVGQVNMTPERIGEIRLALEERRRQVPSGVSPLDQQHIGYAFRLAERKLDIEQEINDAATTRRRELETLEDIHRQESAGEVPFSATDAYREWNERWIEEAFRLAERQRAADRALDSFLEWGPGGFFHRHRDAATALQAVMNASVSHMVDIVDFDQDVNDWSTTTEFDPDPFGSLPEEAVRHSLIIDPDELRRDARDDYGNYWEALYGSDRWLVHLSEAGHRHLTRELRINLTHYLRLRSVPAVRSRMGGGRVETLSERIARSYVIVDNQGRLVPLEAPRLPSSREDIQSQVAGESDSRYEDMTWVHVPTLSLWALCDVTDSNARVLAYVTSEGEVIDPNQGADAPGR